MAAPIKKSIDNQTNSKIQAKFDLVFAHSVEDDLNDKILLDEDVSMSSSAQKKGNNKEINEVISLEILPDEAGPVLTSSEKVKLMEISDNNEIDFNFDQNDSFELETNGSMAKNDESSIDMIGEISDDIESSFDNAIADAKKEMDDGTKKTIIFDIRQLATLEQTIDENVYTQSINGSSSVTSDFNANEDQTNVDISFQNFNDVSTELSDIADDEKTRINSDLFSSEINFSDIETKDLQKEILFDEFELNAKGPASSQDNEEVQYKNEMAERPESKVRAEKVSSRDNQHIGHTGHINAEESIRFQSTIRQLRIERDELLENIKKIKATSRNLEQDNLTIKAGWDESQIEVSLLRKRHMVAIEEINYRLTINEEKKINAIEQARLSESKREKLEQRVRIDFNQIKQREKELETKLEMLSIDVESRIQSRDQKILELRRKIDALEFNMENVSIKEQKSKSDKRKLEEKLNKIMKTLRHSIKNLEDGFDQVNDEVQDDKNNDDYQSGKT